MEITNHIEVSWTELQKQKVNKSKRKKIRYQSMKMENTCWWKNRKKIKTAKWKLQIR